MQVIIKHLPERIDIELLWDYISPIASRKKFFTDNDELKSLILLKRMFDDDRKPEWHAIVRVNTEDSQKRLIKTANKAEFKYPFSVYDPTHDINKISAAEFIVRHHSRDKRNNFLNASEILHSQGEHRFYDRRCLKSKIIPVDQRVDIEMNRKERFYRANVF